ncbi:unnamed protein product [Closterium sp. Naga37s-1]|nr:unnamed protein product [Closterium sp. Naga37s-1]
MRLGRLKFIPYSSMLALMGALSRDISHHHHEFRFRIDSFVPVALFVACTHVMTHYYNEYFDFEADLANKHRGKWNGGSGVLPEGLLPRWLALAAANVLLMGSVVTQLAFFRAPAQCVACATLFLSWAYTAPPFKLHYRGLGEATVAAVLTWGVPVMGALQRRDDDAFVLPTSLRAIIPLLCAQQLVRMMVMNLPDIDSDLHLARRLDGIVFAVAGTAAGSSRDTKEYEDATSDHTAAGKPLKSTMDFGDLPYQATIHVASTALMLVLAQAVVLMMQ